MINIDHIKKLDSKISNVVEIFTLLRDDNQALRSKLENYENRINELEILISSFKKDQSDIENGILNALNQLDKIEDMVSGESDNNKMSPENTSSDNKIITPINDIATVNTPEHEKTIISENITKTEISETSALTELNTEKQVTELDIF